MALVKKLNVGGSIDLLNDELNKELGSYNLKSKDERKVRDALVQFRDFFASPGNGSFSVDTVANKYSITGQGSEKFAGSPDEIKSNWLTGKLRIENDEDAKSIAAAIYNSATKNLKSRTTSSAAPTTTQKMTVNIESLGDYVRDTIYGTENNLQSSFGQLKTDDERKAKVFDFAQQKINDYKAKAAENKDIADYADLNALTDIQTAINNKDWDKFLEASYKIKWEPQKFLLTDPQKEQLKIKEAADKAASTVDKYNTLGITDPTFQQQLYSVGFTEEADQNWMPDEKATWFQGLMQSLGTKVLYNPTTKKHAIVKGNSLFDYGVADQLAPGYGSSWKHDATGLTWYTPSQYKENAALFGEDRYANQNVGREILTNLPGKVYGWSGNDTSGIYNKDILGRRDFTRTLVVDNNGNKQYLIKQADGTYKDKNTGEVVQVELKGFGTTKSVIHDYRDILSDSENPLSVISPKKYYFDMNDVLQALNAQKNSISTKGEYDEDEMNKLAGHLRLIIGTSKNQEEKQQALKAYADLRELFTAHEVPVLNNYTGKNFTFFKQGGVLKAQKGMSFEEYTAKYNPKGTAQTSTSTTPNGKKAVSTKGMLKNMNALDYASLAGAGLSFIPGVGAIGGGISTIADLANDIQRGESLGTTAAHLGMNLGFTALAFFGAGGLKTIQAGAKLAKAGKTADVAFDFAKAGQKAAKLEQTAVKMGVTLPEAIVATKRVTEVGKIVEPTVLQGLAKVDNVADLGHTLNPAQLDVLSKAGYIDEAGKVLMQNGAKVVNSDLHFANGVSKSISSPTLRTTKSLTIDPLAAVGKTVVKGGEKLLGNPKLRKAATIAMVGMGAKDAFDIGKTIADAPDNLTLAQKIGRIKESDLRGAMMAGALGKGMWKEAKINKAILNQTELTKVTNEVRTITANGKSYAVTDKVNLPKSSVLKKVVKSKDADTKRLEATRAELMSKLKGTDAEKKAMVDEILKDGKLPKEIVNNVEAATTAGRKMKATVNDRFNDTAKSLDEYNLAKKALERNITSPGRWNARPDWLGGKKAKVNNIETKRAIKTLTPERKAKMDAILKARKAPKYLPAPPKPNLPPPTIAKPEPHKIDTNMITKVNRAITKGRGKKKQTFWMKEGGILKLQSAGNIPLLGTLDPTSLEIVAKNKSHLNHNPISKTTGIFDDKGQYTPEFIAKRSAITPEWFEANKDGINNLIAKSGSTYKVRSLSQFIAGASDFKPGILHDIVMNYVPSQRVADMPTMASKGMPATPVAKAFQKPVAKASGDITIETKPGFWNQAKEYINPTGVANALMFANTYATNVGMGNAQRQAIADSLYQLPYMPHKYIRIDKPNALLAEKNASQIKSQVKRIGASTSDIDKSMAVQLEGVNKANEVITQGQAADQKRFDTLRGMQLESDSQVDQYNTGILGKNRGLAAEAFKNIHLINANQKLAQNTNFNNYILAANKNIPVAEYKRNQKIMYEAMRNPAIKQAVDEYTAMSNDGMKTYETQYNLERDKIGANEYPHKTFETSPYYTQWQKELKNLKDKIDVLYRPIEEMKLAQQFQQPLMFMKKGGLTLTKEDRLEIQRDKRAAETAFKETELVYKAILHNNEMLQRALIKVFK